MGTTDFQYFLDQADPNKVHQHNQSAADNAAIGSGVGLVTGVVLVAAALTPGVNVVTGIILVVGGGGLAVGGGFGIASSADWKISATNGLYEALGGPIDSFMDGIQNQFGTLQQLTQLESLGDVGSWQISVDYPDGTPGGDVNVLMTKHEDGSATFQFGDGTWVKIDSEGNAYGEIPAGNGNKDILKYDSSTGTITLELHDGTTLTRWTQGERAGWTQVELKNGDKFLYDDKGKLIGHWNSEDSCAEFDDTEEPEEGENPPPEDQ